MALVLSLNIQQRDVYGVFRLNLRISAGKLRYFIKETNICNHLNRAKNLFMQNNISLVLK